MSLAEKKWWRQIFARPKPAEHKDALKDLEAIREQLIDLKTELPIIIKEIKALEELEKERSVANQGLLQVNLETQAKTFDNLLQRYEFLENDVSINALRLQKVASLFLRHAQQAGLTDLIKEKKKDHRWKFKW